MSVLAIELEAEDVGRDYILDRLYPIFIIDGAQVEQKLTDASFFTLGEAKKINIKIEVSVAE